jgi:hypothetical protein
MSPASSSITLDALPASHFSRVLITIRSANIRHRQLAADLRPVLNSTQHARRRARNLGLTVDIQRAAGCPQRAISAVPLPILDISSSPDLRAVVPLQNRLVSAPVRPLPSIRHTTPVDNVRQSSLSPLSPFLSTQSAGIDAEIPTKKLSSRFSISPASSIHIPSLPSCDFLQASTSQEDLRLLGAPALTYKKLPEAPVDETDDGWGCDMSWTPALCMTPGFSTDSTLPVSGTAASAAAQCYISLVNRNLVRCEGQFH